MTGLTEEIRAELILNFARDPILCARQLFSHWFPRPMPWFHRGIIAIILRRSDFLLNFGEELWADGSCRWTKKKLAKLVRCFRYQLNPTQVDGPTAPIFRIRYAEDGRTPIAIDMVLGTHVNLIIPRGYSKTTLINFCNVYKVIYKLTRFTVYVSEAAMHAKAQLATVRRELSGNERIIELYGTLKPDRTSDESWGSEFFETTTGVKMAAKGRGAQIRGMNAFGDRPDTIILDDVEDKESVTTEAQIEKTSSWFKSDVEQALQRDRESCIYAIGTILHPKALLPTLAKDPDYTSICFGAVDPEGEALWDDRAGMSLEAIEEKKQSFARMGKLYEFGLEYMSTVRNEDKVKFRREFIRYETFKVADFLARSIHIDPAISGKANADFTAIAIVGQTEKGRKHVCDFYARRGMTMHEQAEMFFQLHLKWQCTHASCEAVAYQAALSQVIRELMFIKAKDPKYGLKAYFEIRDVWPATRKIERVEGILQPLMASGYLTFQQIWPDLETMLLEWPDGKLDGPDAVAGAVANLEPYAALSFGDPAELEKEYEDPTDYEAPCRAGREYVP